MIKNIIGILVLSIIVLAAIIYGFNSAGSPTKVRAQKFDSTRLSNMSTIQYAIEEYYRNNSSLPQSLATLDSDPSVAYSREIPTDPETKKPYEYIPAGTSYKLCAVFSTSTEEDMNSSRPNMSYDLYSKKHPKGRYCIDYKLPDYLITPAPKFYAPPAPTAVVEPLTASPTPTF